MNAEEYYDVVSLERARSALDSLREVRRFFDEKKEAERALLALLDKLYQKVGEPE